MILQHDLLKSMLALNSYIAGNCYIVKGNRKKKYFKSDAYATKYKTRDKTREHQLNYINIVCRIFNITKKQLISKNRKTNLVFARYICVNYIFESTLQSVHDIGEIMSMSHSNVLNILKNHKNMVETNYTKYTKHVNDFEKYINQ
jgi:chromosomal replication initiation ATPase DnaA